MTAVNVYDQHFNEVNSRQRIVSKYKQYCSVVECTANWLGPVGLKDAKLNGRIARVIALVSTQKKKLCFIFERGDRENPMIWEKVKRKGKNMRLNLKAFAFWDGVIEF